MTEPYLAAAIQMESSADKEANLAAATRLVEEAAALGARLIALPELFNCLGRLEMAAAQAESIPGPTSEALSRLAARLGITLAAGSIAERDGSSGKAFNTSLLFGPDGALLARYRKIHLFNAELPGGVTARESEWISRGDQIGTVATPLGILGTAICYDVRFPELFRRLSAAGAQVLLVPSAFTRANGRDHWEVLLRARAIENQAYVVAPDQCSPLGPRIETFGHSAIIDPWGQVLAMAGDPQRETIVTAMIDLEHLARIRAELPALAHRHA